MTDLFPLAPPRARFDQHHILLVGDQPGDARLVDEALRSASDGSAEPGFRITHVSQVAAASQLVASSQVDLVLLDLGGEEGPGIASLVQLRDAAPQVPIVVLGPLEDSELAMSILREGAQDYLTRAALDGGSLLRTLRHAIVRKRAEHEAEALTGRARAELLQRERSARAAAERAQQRLGLLAEVSAALATPAAPAPFEQLPRLLVPRIADWFFVCL